MSVAAYVVILSAVFSSSQGSTGYQSSISSNHNSLQLCKIAGEQFMNSYLIGNIYNGEPARGNMTCTIVENDVVHKVVVLYSKGDSSKVIQWEK